MLFALKCTCLIMEALSSPILLVTFPSIIFFCFLIFHLLLTCLDCFVLGMCLLRSIVTPQPCHPSPLGHAGWLSSLRKVSSFPFSCHCLFLWTDWLPAAVIRACNCVCLCTSVLLTGCWTSRLFPVLCPDKQSCTQSLHTWTSVHLPVGGSIPIPLRLGGFELGWVHTSSLQGMEVTGIPAATQVVAERFSMLLPGIYL